MTRQVVVAKIDREKLVVTQANKLAEASYFMTLEEKRVVLLMVSLVRQEDSDFKTYRIPIADIRDYLGLRTNKLYDDIKRVREVMNARTISSLVSLSREMTRAGRSLAPERSVKGNVTKTILPNSNIALFDIGQGVDIRLVLQPVESAAFLCHAGNGEFFSLDFLEDDAHMLAGLDAPSRHFREDLAGFDILKNLLHGGMVHDWGAAVMVNLPVGVSRIATRSLTHASTSDNGYAQSEPSSSRCFPGKKNGQAIW
ncbi:MAG: replication initiation protein [Magnetospirillum sp. WYHS-4]